jgi:hypothetical protein
VRSPGLGCGPSAPRRVRLDVADGVTADAAVVADGTAEATTINTTAEAKRLVRMSVSLVETRNGTRPVPRQSAKPLKAH